MGAELTVHDKLHLHLTIGNSLPHKSVSCPLGCEQQLGVAGHTAGILNQGRETVLSHSNSESKVLTLVITHQQRLLTFMQCLALARLAGSSGIAYDRAGNRRFLKVSVM